MESWIVGFFLILIGLKREKYRMKNPIIQQSKRELEESKIPTIHNPEALLLDC